MHVADMHRKSLYCRLAGILVLLQIISGCAAPLSAPLPVDSPLLGQTTNEAAAPAATTPVTPPKPADRAIDPAKTNIGIITLDYRTLQLKAAHFTQQVSCDATHPPASDPALTTRASDVFNANGDYWSRYEVDSKKEGRGVLALNITRVGDFVMLEMDPGDFGGVAVADPCAGSVLFAGSIVYDGRGQQFLPKVKEGIDPQGYRTSADTGAAPAPHSIHVRTGPADAPADQRPGIAAWESVKDLALVQALAAQPYSVLVYLYPRTVGHFDPDQADWVIFIRQGLPVPSAQPAPLPAATVTQ